MSGRRIPTPVISVLDQVASSASNAFLIFALARFLDVRSFGQVSVALAVLLAGVACSRGFLGTRIALLARSDVLRHEVSRACTIASASGVALGVVIALLPGAQDVLVVIAIAAPLVLLHDVLRFHAFAAGRAGLALAADSSWLVFSLVAYGATLGDVRLSAFATTVAWTLGAFVSLLLLMWQLTPRVAIHGMGAWLATDRQERLRYGLDAVISSAVALGLVGIVALTIGATGNAALRGAATLLAPFNVLLSTAVIAGIPALRRRAEDRGQETPLRALYPGVLGLSAAALGLSGVAVALPTALGELVLGSTWTSARPVLVVMGVEYAAQVWLVAVATLNKAAGRSRAVMAQRYLLSSLALIGSLLAGLITQDVVLVAVASALAAWLTAVVSVRALSAAVAEPRAGLATDIES